MKPWIGPQTWIMSFPRIQTRGVPSNREETNRAGMIPTTRLRSFLNHLKYTAAWAPAAATTAIPVTSAWTTQALPLVAEEDSDEGWQVAIDPFTDKDLKFEYLTDGEVGSGGEKWYTPPKNNYWALRAAFQRARLALNFKKIKK